MTPLEYPGRGCYLATHSAREWDVFFDGCLPRCTWVRAGSQRALALLYNKCHIAPSHRRFAHPSWIAGMKLMLDLLLGARKHRYLRTRLSPTCSSLCEGLLGWLLQWHLLITSPVEHASCPSRRHSGRHCLSPGIATWDPT